MNDLLFASIGEHRWRKTRPRCWSKLCCSLHRLILNQVNSMSVYTSWDFNDLNDLGLELKVEPLSLFCLLSIITFWEHTRMILWNRPRAAPPPRRSRAPGGEHSAGEIQKNLIDRRQLATGSLQQRPAFTCVCVCKLLILKQNRRWTSWYWHSC